MMQTQEIPFPDESWYTRPDGTPERVSAGGVVVRLHRGELLVALVRELNDDLVPLAGHVLPKGGLNPDETIEQGALREIEEEVGLTQVIHLGELAVLERLSEKKVYWSINHYGLYFTEQLEGIIKDAEHHFDFGWHALEALPAMFWPDERAMIEKNHKGIYEQVIAHQNPKARKKYFM